jgi:hypothetical protein
VRLINIVDFAVEIPKMPVEINAFLIIDNGARCVSVAAKKRAGWVGDGKVV